MGEQPRRGPYSYGYNRSLYMNASVFVYSLVDMVSKNRNFFLDVGPKAGGTIEQPTVRSTEGGIFYQPTIQYCTFLILSNNAMYATHTSHFRFIQSHSTAHSRKIRASFGTPRQASGRCVAYNYWLDSCRFHSRENSRRRSVIWLRSRFLINL